MDGETFSRTSSVCSCRRRRFGKYGAKLYDFGKLTPRFIENVCHSKGLTI